MLKKLSLTLAVVLATFSLNTMARTECPVANIINIQIESNFIIYLQEGGPWRLLGTVTADGVKERYAALLAAQASGKKIMVAYASNTFNCSVDNYSDPAVLVRTYKD